MKNLTPQQQKELLAQKKRAIEFLASEEDDFLITAGAKVSISIRRADKAFKKGSLLEAQGTLDALSERYPFLGTQPINFNNDDWATVNEDDKKTLTKLIMKMAEAELKPSKIEAKTEKIKERRVGFLGKLFGANPSAPPAWEREMLGEMHHQSVAREVHDTRNFDRLSFEQMGKVYQEYLTKPGFNVARSDPAFVPTEVDMVTQGYKYNISNTSGWINVNKEGNPDFDQKDAYGWKFHIGLDEEPANMSKGVEIICDVLMKHQVAAFKLPRPGNNLNNSLQAGKQVTIYYELDKNKDWKAIFEELDSRLKEAGIKPSPQRAEAELGLGASVFISYRNDKDANGKYVDATSTKDYNPGKAPDPFENILKEKATKSARPSA